jgi:hypothetical protein
MLHYSQMSVPLRSGSDRPAGDVGPIFPLQSPEMAVRFPDG